MYASFIHRRTSSTSLLFHASDGGFRAFCLERSRRCSSVDFITLQIMLARPARHSEIELTEAGSTVHYNRIQRLE